MQVTRSIFVAVCFLLLNAAAKAQLGFDLDIKKPAPYENRELKAEKTPDKPIKQPKKWFQNTTTHYNYFFNTNTKLNEILDRAKAAHKDDYTKLLSFYNYSLNGLVADTALLDSIIAKSKTGIVLHDLRNDWIDDLYMLWGASYYLQQNFDSAYNMFQFINYAFADKEKDGYYRYIGSRMDGSNALSVATKENNSLAKRALSEPPARNDAFIWQVRTMIQQGAFPEAGSLITTLKNDPNFPKRLEGALEEVHALWFYKQGYWDSSAHHLVKALGEARKGQERARWEYLAAQMFEKKGLLDLAKEYYGKSIQHASDPVMEVYARLNQIRMNKATGDNSDIDKNIAELLKMARRDKYEAYRDVIYSMVARMELEKGDFLLAQGYLAKAAKYKSDNLTSSNDAYLELADLSFSQRKYRDAASFYDSVKLANLVQEDIDRINIRKPLLTSLVGYLSIIDRQDSLQRIAGMPEEERSAYIKKLVRQIRRAQGLKDEAAAAGNTPAAVDLFAPQQAKGEWYFYNDALRKAGATAFKQVWGARPNVDNWRRQSDVAAQLRTKVAENTRTTKATSGTTPTDPFTYEAMLQGLPLTPELLQTSNDSIQRALFGLGSVYMNDMEDYAASIESFERIRSQYKPVENEDQVLFNLYYDYTKMGNAAKAAEMKRLLLAQHPNSRFTAIATTGADPLSSKPSVDMTKTYEGIYDLYLEGKFDEAEAAKRRADSIYKTNYWSPQLLYIEAVYQVKQANDSGATKTLKTLIQQSAGSPLAAKAKTMIDVLSRRTAIEEELRKLQIERPAEDTLYVEPMPVAAPVQKKAEVIAAPKDTAVVIKKPVPAKPTIDTAVKKLPVVQQKPNSPYSFKADSAHYAVVVLNKVDVVFVNEAKNAFLRYTGGFSDRPLEAKIVTVNDDVKLLLLGSFVSASSAIGYVQKVKPIAPTQVVPWLKGDKYTFSILSEENLKAVLNAKEFAAYQQFLDATLPVKL